MYNNYGAMPYYQPFIPQQRQPQESYPQSYQQGVQNFQHNPQNYQQGLQGKSVESVEVVKAMDIPLDGSISYFPLTDGTATM